MLPASSGVPEMANLGPDDQALLGEVLGQVAAPFDHVLVDTAAGLGPAGYASLEPIRRFTPLTPLRAAFSSRPW